MIDQAKKAEIIEEYKTKDRSCHHPTIDVAEGHNHEDRIHRTGHHGQADGQEPPGRRPRARRQQPVPGAGG